LTKGRDDVMTTEFEGFEGFNVEKTYNLTDIARIVKRPRTTLTVWVDLFREYLPTIGSGRTLRYRENAIEIFGIISKLKDEGAPNELIANTLRGYVGEITIEAAADNPSPVLANLPELLHAMAAQLQQQRDEIDALRDELHERDVKRLELDAEKDADRERRDAERFADLERRQEERQAAQEQRQNERDRVLMETLRELQSAAAERKAADNKPIWKRMFGGG